MFSIHALRIMFKSLMTFIFLKKYGYHCLLGMLILAFSGCGYTLVGQGSLPGHIKTMAIPTFDNMTLEQGVEDVLTQAMIDVYVRGGKVKLVVENAADAVLIGTIRSYDDDEVIEFNEQNEPLKYRLTVTLDVELRDLTTDTSLWKTEGMQEITNFLSGPDYNLADNDKQNALQELAEELAKKVFALSTEGF